MNLLNKTKTYLIGPMQYANGRGWREEITTKLESIGVIVFNPYNKPFIINSDEDESVREDMKVWMENGDYDKVVNRMKRVRNYDLNLVDRSDFLIAKIIPNVASWGSAEELVIASQIRRPTFIAVDGGKKKTPFWLLSMFPHKYFYDSTDDILEMLIKINNGEKEIDSDRWRLLREDLR